MSTAHSARWRGWRRSSRRSSTASRRPTRSASICTSGLLAPVALNIVCFRYSPRGAHDLDAINEELLLRIQERGIAVPSGTVLRGGKYAIRVAITNHRSRIEDFDALVDAVRAIGAELTREAAEA